VEQHRFASLLNGESGESRAVNTSRAQELCRDAELVEIVRVLFQAQGDSDFLVANSWVVWRQCRIKIALIMFCPTLDRDAHQPFRKPFMGAAKSREPDCEA